MSSQSLHLLLRPLSFKQKNTMFKKENLLFIFLGGFFITNAVIAEFIGAKIFSMERTFGFEPVNWTVFGIPGNSFNLSAGVILWPVVFIMTDVINEYYGRKGVRLLTFLTMGLIGYGFFMVYMAIGVEPADFWVQSTNTDIKPDINVAFGRVFGQGLQIIIGSMTAFLVGQLVDVYVFHYLRRKSGAAKIWLRATGSTVVSQLIDSFIVLFIAFYLLATPETRWPISQLFAVGIVGYLYKFIIAVALTPILYLAHYVIDAYLGKELAEKMMSEAAASSQNALPKEA